MPVTDEEEKKKRAPRKDWKLIIVKHVKPMLVRIWRMNIPINLRMIFYNLVVEEAIGNTPSDYDTLSEKTKFARMNGIIPIDAFVDEVRQTFENGYKDDGDFEKSDDYIDGGINYLRDAPEDYVKSLPTWYKQKNYLEIWIEKAAQYRIFKAYIGNRHVRIVVNRGNTSLGEMVPNIRRLKYCYK